MTAEQSTRPQHASLGAGYWLKIKKTVRYYAHERLKSLRGLMWDADPKYAEKPVFVVGCSRGGTTLVYRTFSESRELGSLQRETHDFWNHLHPVEARAWDSHELTATDASEADRAAALRFFYVGTGRRRFVDKNNQNGLAVPYLHALFPDACFVYIKRSPGDNINSLIEGWKRPGGFGAWSEKLPRHVAIDEGRFQRWCFFLPQGWESFLEASIESVCAFQYRAMNEAILDARELIPKDQWIEMRYEDILVDSVGKFRKAFEAVGIEFDKNLQAHCAEVLAKPYNAFSEIRRDKWRDSLNAARIESVLPEVEAVSKRMGY